MCHHYECTKDEVGGDDLQSSHFVLLRREHEQADHLLTSNNIPLTHPSFNCHLFVPLCTSNGVIQYLQQCQQMCKQTHLFVIITFPW